MIEKHIIGAPLKIALGGRALLAPLPGVGQYAAHIARGFVDQGHHGRVFNGMHWSPLIAACRSEQGES